MENLEIYEKVRKVPEEAQKQIGGGRLKGMTDINPMWRIKTLTELFGPAGFGWYYEIIKEWVETSSETKETAVIIMINLYVKDPETGEWSKPICGIGGSKLLSIDKSGVYLNDEAFKMATTDAMSVACKQLGIGADIYWNKDITKYSTPTDENKPSEKVMAIMAKAKKDNVDIGEICKLYSVKTLNDLTDKQIEKIANTWSSEIISKCKLKDA